MKIMTLDILKDPERIKRNRDWTDSLGYKEICKFYESFYNNIAELYPEAEIQKRALNPKWFNWNISQIGLGIDVEHVGYILGVRLDVAFTDMDSVVTGQNDKDMAFIKFGNAGIYLYDVSAKRYIYPGEKPFASLVGNKRYSYNVQGCEEFGREFLGIDDGEDGAVIHYLKKFGAEKVERRSINKDGSVIEFSWLKDNSKHRAIVEKALAS